MAGTDDTSQADGAASVCSPLLRSKATRRGNHRQAGPQHQGSQSLTTSPVRPDLAAPSWTAESPFWSTMSPGPSLDTAPVSPSNDFWCLLPVAEGPQRKSAVAEGKLPAGQTQSWNASMPSSMETVKVSPLTPFPVWRDEPEGQRGHSSDQLRQRNDNLEQVGVAPASNVGLVKNRRHLNMSTHGALLVGQCVVSMAVFSILIAVMVCQKGNLLSLWIHLGALLALTLATYVCVLAFYETRVLSTVAVLYLQALVLPVVTATSLALWYWILTQATGQTAKAILVGCLVMMEGTALLGFARAVLVWWLLDDGRQLTDGHVQH